MKMFLNVIVFCFLNAGVIGCQSSADGSLALAKNEQVPSLAQAEEFLGYLLVRDEKSIIKYMGDSEIFLTDGKISQDIIDFLYAGNKQGGWKSVLEIAKLDKVSIKLIKQKNNVITVLFYPRKYSNQMNDLSFLENEWMKKYFACEFEIINGTWEFYQNVCFAETDGPYPPEYG